ncbi:hypothetical protein Daesc_005943 [Daldinia eschscholtzii]|uniref:Uncharacterized protein n=1 Tax=Daldinia eschscholtzii TaxID=292717 RepID=A0AAX6MLX3_9PEZI
MQNKPKTFLDLPAGLRQRILLDAGIVCGINISYGKKASILHPEYPHIAKNIRFTYNVIQTCKAIYEQVKSLIFANNGVVIGNEQLDSALEFLRKLSPQHCSSLTKLFVRLHVHPERYPQGHVNLSQEHIAAWQDAAKHILSHATPGKLELYLVCDTAEEDSEATSAVLQPLLDFPGVLAECELRLLSERKKHITDLAEELALRIKGIDPNLRKGPFPFMRLPTEIRRQVLRYTDLVVPSNQVQWSPNKGFHICRWGNCIHEECRPYYLCDKCRPLHCMLQTYRLAEFLGNFCRRVCSGYSPRCQCWETPQALMFVNRTMYQDACDVFYRYNRIIIHPRVLQGHHVTHSTGEGDQCPTSLPVSQFILRYKWPGILSRLRCLEIVFQPINPAAYPEEPDQLYPDWSNAIDLLKTHVNVTNLTIIVHMAFWRSANFRSEYFSERMTSSNNNNEVAFQVHKRLLEPLRVLKDMKRFYVHLEWPWHWSSKANMAPNRCLGRCGFCTSCRATKIESWLERSVMGDEYNSDVIGKLTQTPSYWLVKDWKNFISWDFSGNY